MIRFVVVVLAIAYAIAPIVAGHGVVPLAFAIYPLITVGIVFSAVKFTREDSVKRAMFSLLGMALMYATWLFTILSAARSNGYDFEKSTSLDTMIWLSAPFQVAFLVVVVIVAIDLKLALAARRNEP